MPNVTVRGLVRNVTKARELLKCDKCDQSEGIYVGDVTEPGTLEAPVHGVDSMVIAVGATPHCKLGFFDCTFAKGAGPKDINFIGMKNQFEALAKDDNPSVPFTDRRVVLMSSFETTQPDSVFDLAWKHSLFYLAQAEASLMASGLEFAIVQSGGLEDGPAGEMELVVGHDDVLPKGAGHSVRRSDVARVLVEAAVGKDAAGLRFDLVGKKGTPTSSKDVLKAARLPWDTRAGATLI